MRCGFYFSNKAVILKEFFDFFKYFFCFVGANYNFYPNFVKIFIKDMKKSEMKTIAGIWKH